MEDIEEQKEIEERETTQKRKLSSREWRAEGKSVRFNAL